MSDVIFHLPVKMMETYDQHVHLELYTVVRKFIESNGGCVRVVERLDEMTTTPNHHWGDHFNDGNLHIIENGCVRETGVLNAALAYLVPYWHLNPQGVLFNGPMGAQSYDPKEVDATSANAFFKKLRREFVKTRRSRYNQKRAKTDIPQGCIGVFLQGSMPQQHGATHCTTEEMLRAVVTHADGRPVVIKPHPKSHNIKSAQALAKLGRDGLDVIISDANVHDILKACAVNISFNSAVALEGLMHRKPAVLFGKSDFHHRFQTVTSPSDYPAALKRALARKGGEAKYLYWYFSQLYNPRDPDFNTALVACFESAGFTCEKLGLRLD